MGFKVKSKGKTYILTRQEFETFMQMKIDARKAQREAEKDFNREKENESEEENE